LKGSFQFKIYFLTHLKRLFEFKMHVLF